MSVHVMDARPLRTLDQLGADARAGQAAVEAAADDFISRMVALGEVLLEAKSRLPHGAWTPWVNENMSGVSITTVTVYMRAAKNRDQVLASSARTVHQVRQLIGGARDTRYSPETVAAVKELAGQGVTQREIAARLDIDRNMVYRALHPDKVRQQRREWARRQAEMRRALEREKRDRALRSAAGDISAAYEFLTKARQAIQREMDKCEDRDQRLRLSLAWDQAEKATNSIWEAVCSA